MNIRHYLGPGIFAGLLAIFSLRAAAEPIGDIEVSGAVLLASSSTGEEMRLADTAYTWFSGDRLVTRESTGVLHLALGGSLGIDKHSDVSIGIDEGQIGINVASGRLLYALDTAMVMHVQVGDYRFTIGNGQDLPLKACDECTGAAGIVHRLPGGKVSVSARVGQVSVHNGVGQTYLVGSGQRAVFSDYDGEIVFLKLESETEEEHEPKEEEGAPGTKSSGSAVHAAGGTGWIRQNRGLFALSLIATATAGYIIWDKSNDDDDEPVSP